MAACDVPAGKSFVPAPTVAGQLLVSVTDGTGFRWDMLAPPATPNNQPLLYGVGGPYWANVGGSQQSPGVPGPSQPPTKKS